MPPGVPVIADAKRGDIGNTSQAYARAIFDVLDFDAVTVNPYLGWDSLLPFMERRGRGVFVLCKTSNPGSSDLQDLCIDGEPLYLRVAREAMALDVPADVGLVVGATYAEAMRSVRSVAPAALFLVPGAGAQGGTIEEAMARGRDSSGEGVLLSISRDILYASSGSDFAEAAAKWARTYAGNTWKQS
jgi:orotidine-5'-phosphate decarboxylase